jgi:hypothetical protein
MRSPIPLLAAVAVLLSACGSHGTPSAETGSSPSSSTAAKAGATPSASASPAPASLPIPNGTFHTTATRREARAKGFTNKEIDHWYGPDGKQPLTIVLDNGTLQMIVEGDDGVREVGATGTYTATKKLWVATSTSPGCPGCVFTYLWSFDGNVLSLKLMRDSAGPKDFRLVRLVSEHDYVKVR